MSVIRGDVPGQLHESLKASSPNEKPFSPRGPTVVKPHARKLAKASRRSCERPGKNERTFEQPPYGIWDNIGDQFEKAMLHETSLHPYHFLVI